MRARATVALASLAALTACSVEQGKVPVIDALTLPESVSLDADGTYHVDAKISFHDDDDVVKRVRVQVPSIRAARDYTSPSGKSVTDGALSLLIAGSAPKGPLVLTVTVIDLEGNVSDPKNGTVTLR